MTSDNVYNNAYKSSKSTLYFTHTKKSYMMNNQYNKTLLHAYEYLLRYECILSFVHNDICNRFKYSTTPYCVTFAQASLTITNTEAFLQDFLGNRKHKLFSNFQKILNKYILDTTCIVMYIESSELKLLHVIGYVFKSHCDYTTSLYK